MLITDTLSTNEIATLHMALQDRIRWLTASLNLPKTHELVKSCQALLAKLS